MLNLEKVWFKENSFFIIKKEKSKGAGQNLLKESYQPELVKEDEIQSEEINRVRISYIFILWWNASR